MMDILEIHKTKSGRPALWEEGGGMTNTGFATIVAGPRGEPLPALFINQRGHLACGQHALLPVRVGCLVIRAAIDRRRLSVGVYRITETKKNEDRFVATIWKEDELIVPTVLIREGLLTPQGLAEMAWDDYRADAATAAIKKALCYHCREPHYILQEAKNKREGNNNDSP